MSIVINNGIKFHSTSLRSLYGDLILVREKVLETQQEMIAAYFGKFCVDLIDRATLSESPVKLYPMSKAFDDYRTRTKTIQKDQTRDPEVDFSFSISIIPYKKAVYGIIHTEKPNLKEICLTIADDFSYWDNTDGDENLSRSQWSHRKRTWNTLFEKSSVPQDVGFTFTVDPYLKAYSLSSDECFKFVPSFEERVKQHSKRLVLDERMKTMVQPSQSFDEIMRAYYDVVDWLKTADGIEALHKSSVFLSNRLQHLEAKHLYEFDFINLD